MNAPVRWEGEPEQCGCIRIVVATLEETLACPYGWRLVPGTGWVHTWPSAPPPRRPRPRDRAGGIVNGPDYAARAAAGAEFLDGQVPGWAGRVELATLDLADSCDCVLGQLGGSFQDTLDEFRLSQDDAQDLGFTIPSDESYHRWAGLDAAWAREIVTRREAIDPEYAAGQAAPLCRAHPDDCPNGPGPHAYHPPEIDGLPCCVQPGDSAQPAGGTS